MSLQELNLLLEFHSKTTENLINDKFKKTIYRGFTPVGVVVLMFTLNTLNFSSHRTGHHGELKSDLRLTLDNLTKYTHYIASTFPQLVKLFFQSQPH